ncbi:MAG: phytanoyl-CoA dioxygenase [Bacteroidota bacterium]
MLDRNQIRQFILQGYVRIDDAFPKKLAVAAREILWKRIDADPNDVMSWKHPVVRLGMFDDEPFIKAANTPELHHAFDQLAGKDRWMPCSSMGTFPVRFPSKEEPNDTGWHVDASFPGKDPSDYFSWRINVHSKGRLLLMLFLFSDISENDAPTRLRVGSHAEVARILQPYGEEGLSFMELAEKLDQLPRGNEAVATGSAGTVYLCHPFIAHAAQSHTGSVPRFLAQPPLLPKE